MPKSFFQIENTTSAAVLMEGRFSSAKECIATLEEMAGTPEDGWGDDLIIIETWTDASGAKNSRTMTVNEALAS